jgi:ADP-L-glycero-D-manno-heptose 6-epimerase
MIVVTGGEGFIGRNLIQELTRQGNVGVIPLDTKYETLDEIRDWFHINALSIKGVFHLGAITDTTEMNKELFENYNINSSKFIWDLCSAYKIPLIYASSAATYGDGSNGFDDEKSIIDLKPLNPYGWSKQIFDVWAGMNDIYPPFWYGLKFFNVYGIGEGHKDKMASVAYHMFNQIQKTGEVRLFKSHHSDYKDGDQLRDFIYVDDIVDVCIWMYENNPESGLYNVGTGKARSFNDLATAVCDSLNVKRKIKYFNTPELIRDKYQYFTQAKMLKLRQVGYKKEFHTLEEGVEKYMKKLVG